MANIVIGILKFIAGGISKSSAMISEGVHSLVDCVNELLLLYGIHRSNRSKDKSHPFGYGRELYFWSFIVAILIFGFGAGVSFYQGYIHLRTPSLTNHAGLNYATLAASFFFDGISFLVALKEFNKTRGDEPLWSAVKRSKDPTRFMVLFEDGAALLGVLMVAICLGIEQLTGNPYMDGIASTLVGLVLTMSSALLARESRSLMMGEGISGQTEQKITAIIKADDSVNTVKMFFSLYQSPEEILIVVVISFKTGLTSDKLNSSIAGIKEKIKKEFPKINYIIIQPEE
jgi:cation diffusion facilitator family transporter